MADIFDTSTSEGRSIQQSVGEPNIAPQGRGAGTAIDAEDAFNLRAGIRVDQLATAERARKEARENQRAKVQGSRRLDGLANGLINRYADIDSRVTNPIERNRLKREADLIAISTGGRENAAFLNQVIGKLSTKREARSDGMINILGANGEIIGVDAGSRGDVLQGRLDAHQGEIHEVLPNTVDGINTLLQIDAVEGNHIQQGTVSEMITNIKNQSKRMKAISDDYHVNSNQLPNSQLPQLVKNATTGYLKSVGGIFNTFTSADFMKAVRAGDMTRSDIDIAMQSVRRDMMNEITSQGVPVNTQDIESYITTSIDNIKAAYDNVQKNDLVSLQVQADKTRLLNEITGNKFNAAHNIPEIRGAKEVADYTASLAASVGSLTDASLFAEGDTKRTLEAVTLGQLNTLESLIPVHDNINKHLYQSQFDLADFDKEIKVMKTREDVLAVLKRMGKVTNNVAGASVAPYVRTVINNSIPAMHKAVDEGLLTEEELEDAWGQLEQFDVAAIETVKKAGINEEDYVTMAQEAANWFSDTWDWFFPPASNERITKQSVIRQRGQFSKEE